ncbi:DUF7674 family protein [Streptomyces sp. URMC 126]|uniref:DUF7674 family protein n=1 Tax=Streptomyces sp. URMC 126 TaxID=3423401 RepID=UPI003F1C02C7
MSTPAWWEDFVAASAVLAVRDRTQVGEWRGEPPTGEWGLPVEADEDDVPPLTTRLGGLARSFAEHASRMDPRERRRALDVLEEVLTTGGEKDATAVVTGFFEALLMAADRGFDLRSVWDDLGPESRSACLTLDEFWGTESSDRMR